MLADDAYAIFWFLKIDKADCMCRIVSKSYFDFI